MSTRGQLSPLFTWRSAIVESELASTTRLVALVLSLHMNERGGSCFPSMPTLAKETGLGVSTVREHIGKLEQGAWLIREISHGRGTANTYTATVPGEKPPAPGGLETASSDEENRQLTEKKPPGAGAQDVLLGRQEDVTTLPAPTRQQRDAAWDTLLELYGDIAPHEASLRGKIARDLVIACQAQHGPDVGTETIGREIRDRATAYQRAWPGAAFTDTALHRRWSVFAPTVQSGATPRERAKRWIDAAGWQLEPEDAELMLREFNLGDHHAGAVRYLADVREAHHRTTDLTEAALRGDTQPGEAA